MEAYKPRTHMQMDLDAGTAAFKEKKRVRYYQFREEHLNEEVKDAEEKVKYEYKVCSKIMDNWLGLGLKTTFEAWRDYIKDDLDEVITFRIVPFILPLSYFLVN